MSTVILDLVAYRQRLLGDPIQRRRDRLVETALAAFWPTAPNDSGPTPPRAA